MNPSPEIILFGNDEGIAEAAAELGVRHIPDIRTNEYNTPLVSDLFQQAQNACETELLCYINADIVLFSSFMPAVFRAAEAFENLFLVGARWDYEQDGPVNFSNPAWEETLLRTVWQNGTPNAPTGMDYFVFRPHRAWPFIPPLALGRFFWDTWLLHGAMAEGLAVIDATEFVPIAHQNHVLTAGFKNSEEIFQSLEGKRNQRLAGAMSAFTVLDAPYRFDVQGMIHKR
jgi:hypothetical protein